MSPNEQFRIEDRVEFRTYSATQIKALIAASDLEFVGAFDFGYDIDGTIEVTTATEDVVYVLRKL